MIFVVPGVQMKQSMLQNRSFSSKIHGKNRYFRSEAPPHLSAKQWKNAMKKPCFHESSYTNGLQNFYQNLSCLTPNLHFSMQNPEFHLSKFTDDRKNSAKSLIFFKKMMKKHYFSWTPMMLSWPPRGGKLRNFENPCTFENRYNRQTGCI